MTTQTLGEVLQEESVEGRSVRFQKTVSENSMSNHKAGVIEQSNHNDTLQIYLNAVQVNVDGAWKSDQNTTSLDLNLEYEARHRNGRIIVYTPLYGTVIFLPKKKRKKKK